METTNKLKVLEAIKQDRRLYDTDSQHAAKLGINTAQYSRIMNGETERVIKEDKWQAISRLLIKTWQIAETPVYIKITTVLQHCHDNSICALIVDDAGIGKTAAAQHYCATTRHAAYIDCSQVKSKRDMVAAIASAFGVNTNGKYRDMYKTLIAYLQKAKALVVLDEAGDLAQDAMLEVKALYNATEAHCGWVMMGADGLRNRIERSIRNNKVGYVELFDRFGKRFSRATSDDKVEREKTLNQCAADIIAANAPAGVDVQPIVHKVNGSLRRIRVELSKLNAV